MRPKNIDAVTLNDKELENINGGASQMISIRCPKWQQNFMADVSQPIIFCTCCGAPNFGFG